MVEFCDPLGEQQSWSENFDNHARRRLWLEVGSLYFERAIVKDQRDEFYKLPDSFSTGTIIQKLIVTESGKRIESGIRITAPDEAQILLVPNAMPLSISMRCTEINLSHFEPEYSIDEYSVEVFKTAHH